MKLPDRITNASCENNSQLDNLADGRVDLDIDIVLDLHEFKLFKDLD